MSIRVGGSALITMLALIGVSASAAEDSAGRAADARAGVEFFETRIRPVLADKCYRCHSAEAKKVKGNLLLDSQAGMLSGGDSGPALVPGQPEKSKLIEAIRYQNDDLQMPPKERMPATVVADFENWVRMGAPDPRNAPAGPSKLSANLEKAKTHWAFQPVQSPPPPAVRAENWVKTPIDRFILAKLEERNLAPSPAADKRTLIRRATFDLIGLPPTAEEVAAFEADRSPEAFAHVVDRLLASPHYGECWGRHWLDVARYADTKGYVFEEERRYPYAYTYRDWVIRSINADLPYDRFLIAQLAADQLPEVKAGDHQPLAALGFLTLGRRFLNREPDIIDDRIDVVCRGTMALTVACARCHDHKFDPIPTKDYYALYGVFASSHEPKELPLLGGEPRSDATAAYEAELAKREKVVADFRDKRYGERLAEVRAAKSVGEYLLAAHDARGKNDGDLHELAQQRRLQSVVIRRWRDYLADNAHPVFAAWRSFAALDAKDFAAKAPALLATLTGDHTQNPLVVAAFAGKSPGSLKAVAEIYAALLAANDGATPAADADHEALRRALRGDGAPTEIAPTDAEQLFAGDDEKKLRDLRKTVDELASTHPGAPARAMAMADNDHPGNAHVFVRGNPGNPGDEVPRQFLMVAAGDQRKPFTHGSGRLDLAQAIANRDNPLTARVLVNRVWLLHFGAGLVRTPSDFGLRSDPPSHRELLDHLARGFMDDGWSLKKLHRRIMLSAVYQEASASTPAQLKADPDNQLLAHANRRRLDFEATRDGLLAASGSLDPALFGRAVEITTQPFTGRRTVYGFIDRQNLANVYRTFDFASPDAHSPQRFQTSVPQQALFMMNSPFVIERARAFAKRAEAVGEAADARVRELYRLAYARAPSAEEIKLGAEFVRTVAAMPAESVAAKASPWQYGYGRYDEATKRVTAFTALPHFSGSAWQGGDKLPDPKLVWVNLSANGGHPGTDHDHAAVRRWTAPRDGVFAVSGVLKRPSKEGDGVRGLVVSSRDGSLGDWTVHDGAHDTAVARIALKRGDTLDFVTDCLGNDGFDSFDWAPLVRVVEADGAAGEWSASGDFAGPPPPPPAPLAPWERYAQALLMSNEFVFVD